jgi:tetratricopeptide (TPR) repeat protein
MLRLFLAIVGLNLVLQVLLRLDVIPVQLQAPAGFVVSAVWMAAGGFLLLNFLVPGLFRPVDDEWRMFWARLRHDRRELEELHRKIDHLDKPHHMVQLGSAYLQQGRYSKAAMWLQRASEKDPSLDAQYKLALCHFARGEFAEAVPLLEHVNAAAPKHDYGTAFLRLAQCHHKLGDLSRAAEFYEALLRYNAGHPEGAYHYALLRAEQGDGPGATRLMQTVVSSVRRSPRFQKRRTRHWLWKARWWLLWHGNVKRER